MGKLKNIWNTITVSFTNWEEYSQVLITGILSILSIIYPILSKKLTEIKTIDYIIIGSAILLLVISIILQKKKTNYKKKNVELTKYFENYQKDKIILEEKVEKLDADKESLIEELFTVIHEELNLTANDRINIFIHNHDDNKNNEYYLIQRFSKTRKYNNNRKEKYSKGVIDVFFSNSNKLNSYVCKCSKSNTTNYKEQISKNFNLSHKRINQMYMKAYSFIGYNIEINKQKTALFLFESTDKLKNERMDLLANRIQEKYQILELIVLNSQIPTLKSFVEENLS